MKVTLQNKFTTNHPVCGKIETHEVLISGRFLNCLSKFNSFPVEVNVYSPNYLDKEVENKCEYILSIAYLYK